MSSESYHEGYLDFQRGHGCQCNPYTPMTCEWRGWRNGWFQAKQDKGWPWHEGYDAYQNGISWTDNPHPVNAEDNAWLEWDAGWEQARREEEAIQDE